MTHPGYVILAVVGFCLVVAVLLWIIRAASRSFNGEAGFFESLVDFSDVAMDFGSSGGDSGGGFDGGGGGD